jgi:hypothetical protein
MADADGRNAKTIASDRANGVSQPIWGSAQARRTGAEVKAVDGTANSTANWRWKLAVRKSC